MKKWVCSVCGYVHEGDVPPSECPVCHVGADKFIEQKEERSWAAEHVVGVGKSFGNDVPEEVQKEIIDGLRRRTSSCACCIGMSTYFTSFGSSAIVSMSSSSKYVG